MYKPENEKRASWALSAMTLDTIQHAIDPLDYLTLLKNQTVFNFCAIPQTMAMATLCLCFMNYEMFQRNIKIRKAEAASVRHLHPGLAACVSSYCIVAHHALNQSS